MYTTAHKCAERMSLKRRKKSVKQKKIAVKNTIDKKSQSFMHIQQVECDK